MAPGTFSHPLTTDIMMPLDILVCPLCKGPLVYDRHQQTLTCKADRLVFPIRDGVPVMIVEEARQLAAEGDTEPADSSRANA